MHAALALFAALPTVGTEVLFWLSIFGGIALFHMCLTATFATTSQFAAKRQPQGE